MPVFGQFTQQVTIDGFPALVHDLSIKESSTQRVVAIDFVLEELAVTGQAAAYNSATIGAPVVVTQTVDGVSQSWEAKIVDAEEKRAGAYSFKRLQCRSLEYAASSTRFLDSWVQVPASQVVLQAWQRHAPNNLELQSVSLAGVDTNNTIIEEYASKFDSLYDLMEEVCLLTGWAWKLRGGVLYFFDPLQNTGPAIDQAALKIERDTLTLKESLQGVYNVYRMQAWSYRRETIGRTFRPGDCVDGFLFDPALLENAEIVGQPVIKQQQWRDIGLKVSEVSDDGIVRLNGSVTATEALQGRLSIDLELRSLVWVERLDETSILKYGRRDAPPISDNGGMRIRAASQYLDEMLRYRATPAADLRLNLLGVGWTPDMVVDVFLDDPAFEAALYVTDIQRTTSGNDLDVAITLTSPSEVVDGEQVQVGARRSRSGVDPAYEIGRRVERLERKVAHPAQPLGQNTGIFGVFGGNYTQTEPTGWRGRTFSSYTPVTSDAAGWSAAVSTFLTPPPLSDTAGWQQSVAAVIADVATAEDSAGWQQSVTTSIAAQEAVADSAGWSQVVNSQTAVSSTGGDSAGWQQTITVISLTPPGISASDEDVVLG